MFHVKYKKNRLLYRYMADSTVFWGNCFKIILKIKEYQAIALTSELFSKVQAQVYQQLRAGCQWLLTKLAL